MGSLAILIYRTVAHGAKKSCISYYVTLNDRLAMNKVASLLFIDIVIYYNVLVIMIINFAIIIERQHTINRIIIIMIRQTN